MNKKISVLLPIYNGEKYLQASIESILQQTYKEFELLILNDGSTDRSEEIVKSFSDKRIKYFKRSNSGLASTLNYGIGISQGDYLARQDQDDIALKDRLQVQKDFLDSSPDYALVGTWAEVWVEKNKTVRIKSPPSEDQLLKFDLLFDNPFVHSSIMMRKKHIEDIGLYSTDPSRQPPEDYELWSRVSRKYKIANVPKLLQVYRETEGSMTKTGKSQIYEKILKISSENIHRVIPTSFQSSEVFSLVSLNYLLCDKYDKHISWKRLEDLFDELSTYFKVEKGTDLYTKFLQKKRNIRNNYLKCRYGKMGVILTMLRMI